jgi:hypothetical protein
MPTPLAPVILKSFIDLEDYLQDLNYEQGCDHTAILTEGILYAAFCTDPDGDWILETGDPRDRMEYQRQGDKEQTYQPLPLKHIRNCDTFVVLYTPEAAK